MAQTPPFTLVGTIIGENNRIAIFVDENANTATRLREGERADEWTLRTVEPRSTTLESGGRIVTLDLPEPGAPHGPAPIVSASPSEQEHVPANPGRL